MINIHLHLIPILNTCVLQKLKVKIKASDASVTSDSLALTEHGEPSAWVHGCGALLSRTQPPEAHPIPYLHP